MNDTMTEKEYLKQRPKTLALWCSTRSEGDHDAETTLSHGLWYKCPSCGYEQRPDWGQMRWDLDEARGKDSAINWGTLNDTIRYECINGDCNHEYRTHLKSVALTKVNPATELMYELLSK